MFKIILFLALGAVWFFYWRAVKSGRITARETKGRLLRRHLLVPRHRKKGRALLFVVTGLVLTIELMVRWRGGVSLHDALFWIHISFSVLFFACLILLNSRLNGLRSSSHRLLAYSSLVLLVGVTLTAIPIILRLPV